MDDKGAGAIPAPYFYNIYTSAAAEYGRSGGIGPWYNMVVQEYGIIW